MLNLKLYPRLLSAILADADREGVSAQTIIVRHLRNIYASAFNDNK
ncbi:hypothetical protein [Photobacterium damselae]